MKRTWSQWLAGLALGLVGTTAQAQNMVVVPSSALPPAQPISSPATTTEYVVQPGETIVNAGGPVHYAPAPYAPQSYAPSNVMRVSHNQGGGGEGLFGGGDGGGSGVGAYGSIGMLIIQPVWQRNPAAALSQVGGGTAIEDFQWNLRATPEVTIGFKNCEGLGVRAHWFQFDQGEQRAFTPGAGQTYNPANPLSVGSAAVTAGESLLTESGLALHVWDFEVTQDAKLGCMSLVFGGGVRYAHINQEYNAFETGANGVLNSRVISGHNFNGIGPAVSLEAHRPVGGNGFGLYGNTHASLLFGSAKHNAFRQVGTAETTFSTQYETDVRPNATIEVGAEYDRCVGGGAAHAFFQLGLHSQVWWNAGSASRSNGLTGGVFDQTDSNIGLIGLAIRGGLRY